MNCRTKFSSLFAVFLLIVGVVACSSGSKDPAIPDDKKDYVGDWRGQFPNGSMKLNISSDGGVNYERITGSNTKTISGGKISKFDGNDFEVTVLLVSTTFKVQEPPHRDGDKWKMTVDGVELSHE